MNTAAQAVADRPATVSGGPLGRAWWVAGAAGITGGGAMAALINHGRTDLTNMSLKWAMLAVAVAAGLLAFYFAQSLLIRNSAQSSLGVAMRRAAWSFSPLALLWPLILAVQFSDTGNHIFVFYPGIGLYWGGLAFVFVVCQLGLGPLYADGDATWLWYGAKRALQSLRAVSLDGPNAFPVVLAAYAALRVTVLFAFDTATRIDPKRAFGLFYDLATLTDQGVYPYLSRWSEYPPAWPWFSTGVYRAVSFFGVNYERYYIAITLTLLLFGIGNLILVYKLTYLAWGRRAAINAAWGYTVLAVPMHEWLRTFGSMAIFFFLLSIYLAVSGRRYLAVLAAVMGIVTKVTPVASGVLIMRYADGGRQRVLLVVTGAIYAGLALVPFYIAGRKWFEASFGNMLVRPPWQTPWALLDGHFGQGWVNRYRLHPPFATDYDYVGRLPAWFWALPALGLVAFYAYTLLMKRPSDDPLTQIRFGFLSLIAFSLYLKGWSPSFVNWFFPFLLIIYPNGRGLAISALLGMMEIFWRPLGAQFGSPDWFTALVVGVRTAVFIFFAALMIRTMRSTAGPPRAETPIASSKV